MKTVELELLSTLDAVRAALDESHVTHVFIGALPVLAWGRPRSFVAGKAIGPTEPGETLPDIRSSVVLGKPLVVASCESSIIYKLIASRPKDLADVESMFEAQTAIGARLGLPRSLGR